jgi:hypothetical protein
VGCAAAAAARGEVGALGAWPLPRVIDMLHKLCHDAMRVAAGAAPRYFRPRRCRPPRRQQPFRPGRRSCSALHATPSIRGTPACWWNLSHSKPARRWPRGLDASGL